MSFGEVRSIAQREPTEDSWNLLCVLLDRAHEHEVREVLIPYLEGTLERWPDAVRVVSPAWMNKLAEGEVVPQLALARALDLRSTFAGVKMVNAIGEARAFGRIRQVYASGKRLGPAGVTALLGQGAFPAMEVLHLDDASLSDDGVAALCRLDALRGVRELSLANNTIGPVGMATLASAEVFEALEDLDVSSNVFGVAGVRALAGSPWAHRLTGFRMSFDRAGWGAGLGGLLDRAVWSGLRELVISGAYACPGLAESLAGSAALDGVEVLGLNWDLLGCQNAALIFGDGGFARLRSLDLRRNLLRVPGAQVLADAELPALERVYLSHNLFGEEGRAVMAQARWWSRAKVEV